MTGDDGFVVTTTPVNDAVSQPISQRTASLRVAVGLALAGILVGALWAWLAPSLQGVVALNLEGARVRGYVGEEADHLFIAAFLMVGFLGVLAIVAAVWAWSLRAHRGPEMVCALTIGAMASAAVATGVGAALVRLRYGTVDVDAAPVSPEHRVHYVVEAPAVFFGHSPWQIVATLVFPAGIVALAYAIGALSTARDDLGASPPRRATGPAPTGDVAPPGDPSIPSR